MRAQIGPLWGGGGGEGGPIIYCKSEPRNWAVPSHTRKRMAITCLGSRQCSLKPDDIYKRSPQGRHWKLTIKPFFKSRRNTNTPSLTSWWLLGEASPATLVFPLRLRHFFQSNPARTCTLAQNMKFKGIPHKCRGLYYFKKWVLFIKADLRPGVNICPKNWNCLSWNFGYFETVCTGKPENLQNCLAKN